MNYSLNNESSTNYRPSTSSKSSKFARVVDVILDSKHPRYVDDSYIGAVIYTFPNSGFSNKDTQFPIAFRGSSTIQKFPVKNEIVELVQAPSELTDQLSGKQTVNKTYYKEVVNVYNNPNHNASPGFNSAEQDLGDFEEGLNINPLKPLAGDILVEGRQGQSIRLTGKGTSAKTIISNGQAKTDNAVDFIEEDINEDPSSIYLTSDESVNLEQIRTKFDSYRRTQPTANSYEGAQVVINSGRIFFNAKEDSILHSSNEAFGATARTVNLDAEEYIGLDGTKIYLGKRALQEEAQPVLLGNETELYIQELLGALQAFSTMLQGAKTLDPTINFQAGILTTQLNSLASRINPYGPSRLKSKKVFTE